jgi:hypothetical protein
MGKETSIEEYRVRVRTIQDNDEAVAAHKRRGVAERNDIALKTASAFVVIDTGKKAVVYGLSSLTPAQAEDGLIVFAGQYPSRANIRYCFAPGMDFEIAVPIGESGVDFKVAHAGKMEDTFCYARAYKTHQAATAHAVRRNARMLRPLKQKP